MFMQQIGPHLFAYCTSYCVALMHTTRGGAAAETRARREAQRLGVPRPTRRFASVPRGGGSGGRRFQGRLNKRGRRAVDLWSVLAPVPSDCCHGMRHVGPSSESYQYYQTLADW